MKELRILLSCGDEPQLYEKAIRAVGAVPTAKYLPDIDDSYDGLVLCGGVDVDPARYGEALDGSVDIDLKRDEVEYALIKAYLDAGKPILGICRGHQILNVYFGGSLHQDIPEVDQHRRQGEDMTHEVSASADSILGRLYGESFAVNSVHHQAVKALGEGFRATADWQGQYVEAIEHCTLPIFSVQWHPERISFENKREGLSDGGEIFKYFIGLCEANCKEHVG